MTKGYARTCKEVFEVLRLTPKAQLELIPIEVLNKLKDDSKSYTEKYKLEFDKMGDPKISHEAQVMILSIYRKYFLQDNEREILNKKLQKNDNQKEIKKAENYNNPNDIFYKANSKTVIKNSCNESNISNEENNKIINENNALIVTENKVITFIKNIFIKIKNIFK